MLIVNTTAARKAGELTWYDPTDQAFAYEGRIDFDRPQEPVFVNPCSYVQFRMGGRRAAIAIKNWHSYFENTLGVLVDGEYRGKILLHDGTSLQGETAEQFMLRLSPVEGERFSALKSFAKDVRFYDLAQFLDGKEHELTVFKRMDSCHYFSFCGLAAEEGTIGCPKTPRKVRRIEVYGDSISCGEVSEAVGRVGSDDPEGHNGIYSNSYYSYPWILARGLGARLHDVSQGGIALQDDRGWFNLPDAVGMLSCYDKIQNNPSLGERKPWNFQAYVPHVVIVAIGQNDAHPENYMAEAYEGEKAMQWREDYRRFIGGLREKYPKALIVLTTTILGHDPAWDRAIGQVCNEMRDPKIRQFLYEKNGCGTSGHVRIPEAEKMAREMQGFLEGLGEEIWED